MNTLTTLMYVIKVSSIRGGTSRLDPQIHLGSRVDAVDNKRPAHAMWVTWRGVALMAIFGQSGHQLDLEAVLLKRHTPIYL